MTSSDAPAAAPAEWRELKIGGFIGHVGPMLSQRKGEGWRYGLRARDVHANLIGVIHGGTLTTLLDQTATLIAIWATGEKAVMTMQMDTRFLGPAKVGDLIEAEATLRHRTKSTLFLDAQLSVEGKPVADASLIMKIVQRPVKKEVKDE